MLPQGETVSAVPARSSGARDIERYLFEITPRVYDIIQNEHVVAQAIKAALETLTALPPDVAIAARRYGPLVAAALLHLTLKLHLSLADVKKDCLEKCAILCGTSVSSKVFQQWVRCCVPYIRTGL